MFCSPITISATVTSTDKEHPYSYVVVHKVLSGHKNQCVIIQAAHCRLNIYNTSCSSTISACRVPVQSVCRSAWCWHPSANCLRHHMWLQPCSKAADSHRTLGQQRHSYPHNAGLIKPHQRGVVIQHDRDDFIRHNPFTILRIAWSLPFLTKDNLYIFLSFVWTNLTIALY